jgi:hypothetical protein
VPAPAVIPALIAYNKVAAVETLVVVVLQTGEVSTEQNFYIANRGETKEGEPKVSQYGYDMV